MAVSSSDVASNSEVATVAVTMSANEDSDASLLRSFAVIICNECQYLEFPGCDVHGSLYTEKLMETSDVTLHAKCPSCSAATNNARPFRDGCRRCKAVTTVYMWACSLQEIQQALKAFPVTIETIQHTILYCQRCCSSIFPRARDILTQRTTAEPLSTTNGKPLKVANFQLSMPHVDGCLRRGMPLQALGVLLPKSELKFVAERVEGCPLAPKLIGSPQYRSRPVAIVTEQNHLHQVAIRLLSTVIDAFDPNSVAAVGPLQQVVAIMEKIEPLALFTEWSPPRLLSQEKVVPVKVTSSSAFDDQHRASQILENGLTFWRSAKKANGNIPPSEEWLLCQFSSAVTISFIELKWHVNLLPGRFSVSISRDGSTFDTVAVVLIRNPESQILLPKGTLIISLKITMFLSEMDAGKTIGLVSITFKKALCSSVYTSTRLVLRNIQYWLQDATVSSLPDVRDLALQALQKFLLASGSLCGLLDLAACLLFNTRFGATVASCKIDMQAWNQLDLLSEVGQSAAQEFVKKLAASIQRIVNWGSSHVNVSDNPVIDTLVLFHEKNYPAESDTTCKDISGDTGSSASLVTLLIERENISKSIKRRSQLGMVVLHMLSEISAWQMKRMQKGEEFTGKQELQLMHLEEPFSMEICPDFFGISNQLLVTILARWLPDTTQQQSKSKKDHGEDSCFRDLYDALSSSFELFWLNTEGLGDQIGISSNSAKHFGHSKFSPDGVCVAVLEIISPHLRRLVLSRIDPLDTGITQVAVQNKDNLMSAPPVLSPIVSSLEKLISLGTKRSDAFFPLSLKAAAAMETGTEAFYPSPHQRTKVLAARMGKGATLEVQVRWPAQEYEQEDPRYERLILMLQLECIKLGIRHVIRGSWYFFIHLLVDVPSLRDTEEFLTQHFASCIQRAGFLSWQVAAGAQELSIHLQRHLHWNRADMSQDSGVGWIRVYPADVAAYDEVLVDVEDFLTDHARYRIAMARP